MRKDSEKVGRAPLVPCADTLDARRLPETVYGVAVERASDLAGHWVFDGRFCAGERYATTRYIES
jgi:hypothetical protein